MTAAVVLAAVLVACSGGAQVGVGAGLGTDVADVQDEGQRL